MRLTSRQPRVRFAFVEQRRRRRLLTVAAGLLPAALLLRHLGRNR